MKKVLITGSSSGIGRDLAYIFAKNNYNLVLLARRKDRLEEIKSHIKGKYQVEVDIEVFDLLETDKIDDLIEKHKDVDILINNAGLGIFGFFNSYSSEIDEKILVLNTISPTLLTKAGIKYLKKGSKIVNISSTAGYQPVPLMATYSASKSYLIDFTLGISEEVEDKEIYLYCPGETKTEFQEKAKRPKSSALRGPIPDSSDVALDIFESIKKGKKYRIYGKYNRFLIFIAKFLPKRFIAKSIYKNNIKL